MTALWVRYKAFVLWPVCALMILAAGRALGDGFGYLLFLPMWHTSLDFDALYRYGIEWFSGRLIYRFHRDASYPPGTYVLLWPFIGWCKFEVARIIWACLDGALIAWLMWINIRESGAKSLVDRVFVGLMLPACGSMRTAIGNGQPIFISLVPVVAATFWLHRREAETRLGELKATLAFLAGLIKPHLVVPMFTAAAVSPSRRRVLVWAGAAYLGATLFATSFQLADPVTLFRWWLRRVQGASTSASWAGSGAGANVHSWMAAPSLASLRLYVSFGILGLFAVWSYFYRRTDPLLMLGIGAAVARLWTYHRSYDDVLMVLPAVALYRIAATGTGREAWRFAAGGLLAVLLGSLVGLRFLDPLHAAVGVIWPLVLVFLLVEAHFQKVAMQREEREAVLEEAVA
jgi:hypothetical protein